MAPIDQPTRQAPRTFGADADVLWHAHGPAALRLATVLVGADDAHDVTVNAFVRMAHTAERTEIDNPRGYLIRSVTNEARSHHRQIRRRWRRDLAAVRPDSTVDPDSHVDVRRAISSLTVRQRAVVYLVYWEDLTEAAVAELLQLSTGTVHHVLVSARARLRRSLK